MARVAGVGIRAQRLDPHRQHLAAFGQLGYPAQQRLHTEHLCEVVPDRKAGGPAGRWRAEHHRVDHAAVSRPGLGQQCQVVALVDRGAVDGR
jgi:hypothetical protein